jgi:hypothetical protein
MPKCTDCERKYHCEDCGKKINCTETSYISENVFTFLDEGKSINQMRKENPELFWKSQDWYEDEAFANATCEPKSLTMSVGAMKDFYSKTFEQQSKMAKDFGGRIPTCREQTAMLIEYYKKTGIRLYPNTWSRCSDRTAGGRLAIVGFFDADGMDVDYDDADAGSYIGASFTL